MEPDDPRMLEWQKMKEDLEDIIQDLDFDDAVTAEHLPELRELVKPLSEFRERVNTVYATPDYYKSE